MFTGKGRKRFQRTMAAALAVALVTMPFGMGGIPAFAEENPVVFDIGTNPESVTAELQGNGRLVISGVGEIQDFTPETAPFRAIAGELRSVEIGSGISALGNYLFYNCENLGGELELPQKLVRIGERAFSGDSAEQAPKFDLILNPFTEADVARLKEDPAVPAEGAEPEAESSQAPEEGQDQPAEPQAETPPESNVPKGEVSETGQPQEESSGLESSGENAPETSPSEAEAQPPESAPAGDSATESAQPKAPEQEEPSAQEEPVEEAGKNKYEITTVTQQELGEGVFFLSEKNADRFFSCSPGNESFRAAMLEAGYTEAQEVVSAVFDYGEGSSSTGDVVSKRLAVSQGAVILPQALPEFSAPQSSSLYTYAFGGWTEYRDEAGVIRQPGSRYEGDLTDLYFIAAWNRETLLKIQVERTDTELRLSVPNPEGYELTSFCWQVCEVPQEEAGQEPVWMDLPGGTEQSYTRELEPGDMGRMFRCVVTLKKKQNAFVAFFSSAAEEELALDAVYGAARAGVSGHISFAPGQYNGAPPSGTGPAAIDVEGEDYAVVPDCTYVSPDASGLVVFNGWMGSDNNLYDPGQVIRPDGNLTLEAQWAVATVKYVNGASGSSGDGTEGQPSSNLSDMISSLPSDGTKYTNIIVICGNTNLTGADVSRNCTITNESPTRSYTGTLTISGNVNLGGNLYLKDLALNANENGARLYNVYAQGHEFIVGQGVATAKDYCANLFGGYKSGAHTYNSKLIVQSGSFMAVFGGNEGGDVTGSTSVQLSGSAKIGLAFGGSWSWSGNTSVISGGTEILMSGNATAAALAGGNRCSDDCAVKGLAHIVIGGSAAVEDPDGHVRSDKEEVDWGVSEFVAGSGTDTCSKNSEGNSQGGTKIEVRENGRVAGDIFGGSGDSWGGADSTEAQKAYVSTSGGMEIVLAGNAQVGGSVYGGGNNRSCKGDVTISLEGGTVAGSVYGGGQNGHLTDGSVTISVSEGASVQGSVYGGGNAGDVAGSTQVNFAGSVGSESVPGSIYGGGKEGNVGNGASVAVTGGTITDSVYGGGEKGAVTGNTSVSLSGGTVKQSVYGGSQGVEGNSATGTVSGGSTVTVTGGSLGSTDADGNPMAETGNVFGGGEFAATSGESSVTVGTGSFSIMGSVYGGGSQAPSGSSSVRMDGGEVRGGVFGAGWGKTSSTEETLVEVTGGTVAGSVYGGGQLGGTGSGGARVEVSGGTMGSVFGAGQGDTSGADAAAGGVSGPTVVTVSGGTVNGSVYGGGDYGTVGHGSMSGSGAALTMTNTTASSTSVTVTGGSISAAVFGGGSGSGMEDAFGAVFGSTTVSIKGGSMHNIFGGSNSSYVSGDTSVSVKAEQGDLTVSGTVFGGGNLSGGEGAFQEIYLVQGKADVQIDGSGGHKLTIDGSVYGSGNLTLVKNTADTKIVIQDFNGSLESVQRAGSADIIGSTLYLIGADDVTEAVTRYYSLSQIGDLRLIDQTLLRVDKEARELGAIGNYVTSGGVVSSSKTLSTASTLQIYQGKKLQISNESGAYGPVTGVLLLDIVTEGADAGAYGVSIQASESSEVGSGSGSNTGAFVKADTPASQGLNLVSGRISGSHSFWRLGGATTQVELTIRAEHKDNGGTGLATQAFAVETTAMGSGGGTVYAITERKQTGSFFLVKPTENPDGSIALPALAAGQTTGNTFALRLEATSGEEDVWQTAACAYMLTADDTNCGAPGVWLKEENVYPVSGGTGKMGEFTLSLAYNPEFSRFTGGTVEFILKEYQAGAQMTEETLESTTVVKLTLEGGTGAVSHLAYGGAGRKFQEITGTDPVEITSSGAVTAYYCSEYYPLAQGASNMSLILCRVDGETPAVTHFPKGTRVVLADRSDDQKHQYYMYRSAQQATLPLADFSAMSTGGHTSYPGPLDNTSKVTEKLMFAVDFSEAQTKLPAGAYQIRLSYTKPIELESTIPVAFTITSEGEASLGLGLLHDKTTGTKAALELTTNVPPEGGPPVDTRYADGAEIRLTLADSASGAAVPFPSAVKMSGDAEGFLRDGDGTLSFSFPASTTGQVSLDFSEVNELMLASGTYNITAEMRPRPGLQISTTKGVAGISGGTVEFTLSRGVKLSRSIGVTIADKTQRLADVSKGPANLEFTVSTKKEDGDTLEVEVQKKTRTGPEDESYTAFTGAADWCKIGTISGENTSVTVTVPQGTKSGDTYRVWFRIVDSSGLTVAEEPFNFIVK